MTALFCFWIVSELLQRFGIIRIYEFINANDSETKRWNANPTGNFLENFIFVGLRWNMSKKLKNHAPPPPPKALPLFTTVYLYVE